MHNEVVVDASGRGVIFTMIVKKSLYYKVGKQHVWAKSTLMLRRGSVSAAMKEQIKTQFLLSGSVSLVTEQGTIGNWRNTDNCLRIWYNLSDFLLFS